MTRAHHDSEGLQLYIIPGPQFWKLRQKVEEQREIRAHHLMSTSNSLKGVETFFLEQPLDHFNGLSKVCLIVGPDEKSFRS